MASHMGVTVAVVIFGGVKYGAQIKALGEGLDVLVATPGRLLDHMQEKTITLRGVEIFVLDEADQMLDLGFEVLPIRKIVAHIPKVSVQNLFFSATMPTEIGKLAGELLNDPLRVSVTPAATTVEKVNQRVLFVEQSRKRAPVLRAVRRSGLQARHRLHPHQARLPTGVARAAWSRWASRPPAIHGDKTQGQRERALAAFKAGEVRALVATDIAARGIDVDAVSHVVNYDLPYVPESYVHRIGRTARLPEPMAPPWPSAPTMSGTSCATSRR